jgi:hypothetical protein
MKASRELRANACACSILGVVGNHLFLIFSFCFSFAAQLADLPSP